MVVVVVVVVFSNVLVSWISVLIAVHIFSLPVVGGFCSD